MDSRSRDALSGAELLDAVEAWQPDAGCLGAGDEHLALTVRCWAAAGLSDTQIEDRVRALVPEAESDIQRHDAAYAVARHCAFVRMPWQHIGQLLVQLAASVPDWRPTDPDDIANLDTAAVAETHP